MKNLRNYLYKKWINDERELDKLNYFFEDDKIKNLLEKKEKENLRNKIKSFLLFIVFTPIFIIFFNNFLWFFWSIIISILLAMIIYIFIISNENRLNSVKREILNLIDEDYEIIIQKAKDKYYKYDYEIFKKENFLNPIYKFSEINKFSLERNKNFEILNYLLETKWYKKHNDFEISKITFKQELNLGLDKNIIIRIDRIKKLILKILKMILYILILSFVSYFSIESDDENKFITILLIISTIVIIGSINWIYKKYFSNKEKIKEKNFYKWFELFSKNKEEYKNLIDIEFSESLINFSRKYKADFLITNNAFYIYKESESQIIKFFLTLLDINPKKELIDLYIERKIHFDFYNQILNFYKKNSKRF